MANSIDTVFYVTETDTHVIIKSVARGVMDVKVQPKGAVDFDAQVGKTIRNVSRMNYDPTYQPT